MNINVYKNDRYWDVYKNNIYWDDYMILYNIALRASDDYETYMAQEMV